MTPSTPDPSTSPAPDSPPAPDSAPAPGGAPSTVRNVPYKGEPLDAARGPGLGCFWLQMVILAILIVVTPFSVWWGWPDWLSAALLFITIGFLLVAGQTMIFLMRLVAADRRSRRRPLASRTRTVGELEDQVGEHGQEPD